MFSEKIKLFDKTIGVLILVNVYPIVGVLLFNWSFFSIVSLYIIETIIIGLFNVIKMLIANGKLINKPINISNEDYLAKLTVNSENENLGCLRLIIIPFFLFHYNFFIFVQSFFVVALSGFFGSEEIRLSNFYNIHFVFSIVLIIGSHAYSLYVNFYKKGEYLKTSPELLMIQPYKRIVIQQLTVILGTFIILLTRLPVYFLVVLILVKIFFDIQAHLKVHRVLE